MHLLRLRLVNFRRFKDVDLELPDGVMALVGRNGAGKSTLLESVGWCLFGHDAARTGKDLLKRRGAAPSDDVHVHVAFRFGGHTYEVTRELLGKGGSHVASVRADGQVVVAPGAQSGRESTAYVERLFHMDRDAFFTSLIARQRELSSLSDAKPAERKRILLSLLRIDAVDVAISDARQQRRDSRKMLDGMRATLRDPAPLRVQLGETKAALAKHEEESVQLDARIEALTEEVEERRRVRDESRARQEQHRALLNEMTLAQARAAEVASESKRREDELARCVASLQQAEALSAEVALIPETQARIEALQALRILHDELSRILQQAAVADAEAAAAAKEVAAAQAATAEASRVREEAAGLPAARAALEQALDERQKRRLALEGARDRYEQMQRLRTLLTEAAAEREAALGEARDATEALSGASVVKRLVARLPQERARIEAEASEAERAAAEAHVRALTLRKALDDLEGKRARVESLGPESPCPTCTRPLREHHGELLHGFAEEAAAQREALQAAEAAAQAAQAALLDARGRLAQLAEREREIRQKEDRLARDEMRLAAANERAREAEARLARLQEQVGQPEAATYEPAHLAAALAEERAAHEALRAHSTREATLSTRLQALARDEALLQAALVRESDARRRAEALRADAASRRAEPFDPKALQAAQLRLKSLESVRERQSRLYADADRAGEIRLFLEEAKAREAQARAAVADAKARVDALAFDVAVHAAAEAAAESADARIAEARVLRERLRGDRLRLEDDVRRLQEEIARQEALAAQAADLEKRVRLLERLAGDREAGLLPEFKDHLISRIRPLLSTHAGRLFRELTDGRYADLELGDDYDLLVHDDGEAYALSRFSGGEADLANLCLRLAVGQVVAERAGTEGFGFLALDEVFGSQDETRKRNILDALRQLTGRFRQILLITHIEDVKEAAEHVLRVEALDDGTSRVVLES